MSVHGHSVDEYLETIYFLTFPIGEYGPVGGDAHVLSARVAQMLSVSRPTVSEMMKRLENEGLIDRDEKQRAILTEHGMEVAVRVVRKHRIVECFLTQFLGYTAAEAHEQADSLGATFTDEMTDRIAERLNHPERCPHGWPIDTEAERQENLHLRPLADIEPGSRVRIVRLAEHDGDLLNWFYDQGLAPGAEIDVIDRTDAGELRVRLGEDDRLAGEDAAAGLFVLPAAA